jgi:hypothetical protein
MTTDNFDKFGMNDDDDITSNAPASYNQDAVDEFELGGTGMVRLAYANGIQRNLVDEDGTVTSITAVGWTIDATKAPDNLTDAMAVLIGKGMVQTENIQYSSGKIVPSYIFARQIGTDKRGMPVFDRSVRMIPLVHSVPNKGSIAKSEANQKGLVYGTYTDYDDQTNEHTTGGYSGFLAILPDLYEAGYKGKDNEALPILIRLKGSSSKELYNAVMEHGVFIKALRDFKIKDLVKNKIALDKAKQQINRRVNMFTYTMKLSPSDGTKRHGDDKQHLDVYEIVNKAHLYDQLSDAYESLYCGKTLHGNILPLVYAEPVAGQPLVAGGEAVDWCREHMAYQESQQDIWNPFRNEPGKGLQYGSRQKAPVWMTNIYAKIKAGTYDKDADKPSANNAGPVQPEKSVDETQGMMDFVKAAGDAFFAEKNQQGMQLVEQFQSVASDDEMDQGEQDAQLNDLFGQISAMRRKRRSFRV